MGGVTGNWSNIPGSVKGEEGGLYDPRRVGGHSQLVRGPPPPAHSSKPRVTERAERAGAGAGGGQYRGAFLAQQLSPQLSRPVSQSGLVSPSAKSDPGGVHLHPPHHQLHQPPPAHGGLKVSGSVWPPPGHRVSPATTPLDLGQSSNKRKSEPVKELEMTKAARLTGEPLSPGQLHRVTEPSTLGCAVITAEATPITSVVNTALQANTSEPETFKYVHKLKRAWIKSEVRGESESSSLTTSPAQLTRSTPSPVGSTKSTGSSSNKGFPSAVKSASEDLKMNGADDDQDEEEEEEGEEEEEEEEDFSSDNEDSKRVDQQTKKPRGRPGPKSRLKVPRAKGGKSVRRNRKTLIESDNNSESEKDSDSSKNSKKSELAAGRKRGRKPGPRKKTLEAEVVEPKAKRQKPDDSKQVEQPFVKPTISQLKKSGESFLQDASCIELAPKLSKCRECHRESRTATLSGRREKQQPLAGNFFCRFDTFRRLRYSKNGQIAVAGFCDPKQDARQEDLQLWLPSPELAPANMDRDAARLILDQLASQFGQIYRAEQEAELYAEEYNTPAWKRVVQGVREMCDVCEATLFNKHWACGKCGFVVCIDCYRQRVNGVAPSTALAGLAEDRQDLKDKDDFAWLLCNNNKSHQLDTLMLTQIIAGDALEEVNTKLKLLTKPGCVFKDETDLKPEQTEEVRPET